MSKRFNAALRHSVGCVKDSRGYRGLPCDEAGWVNVEQILKYDSIWKDGKKLEGTSHADFDIIVKRWDMFQQIIFTEYRQTKRVRAQVLALTITKGSLMNFIGVDNPFTNRINRSRIEIEKMID